MIENQTQNSFVKNIQTLKIKDALLASKRRPFGLQKMPF